METRTPTRFHPGFFQGHHPELFKELLLEFFQGFPLIFYSAFYKSFQGLHSKTFHRFKSELSQRLVPDFFPEAIPKLFQELFVCEFRNCLFSRISLEIHPRIPNVIFVAINLGILPRTFPGIPPGILRKISR